MTKCNCFICANRVNKDKCTGYLFGRKEELEQVISDLMRLGITPTSIENTNSLGGYLAACKQDLDDTEMHIEELLKQPPTLEQIAEHGGCLKLLTCFATAGINTTEQLLNQTPRDLLRLPGFGKVSLNKLSAALSKFNLKLKEE